MDAGSPRRRHTGRRRNDAAQDAILDAAFRLLSGPRTAALTIDAIAAEAGVGRQTIYRWWPSKGAVVADALARHAQEVVPERDTGSFTGDLRAFLTASFAGLADEGLAGLLRQIVAEAQHDEHVARVLADFTAVRRAALRALLERGQDLGELAADADLDMLVEMAYGVLYYRLLVGHAPLDEQAARSLAAELTRSAGLPRPARLKRPSCLEAPTPPGSPVTPEIGPDAQLPTASRSSRNAAARRGGCQEALRPLGLGKIHRRAGPRGCGWGPISARGWAKAVR